MTPEFLTQLHQLIVEELARGSIEKILTVCEEEQNIAALIATFDAAKGKEATNFFIFGLFKHLVDQQRIKVRGWIADESYDDVQDILMTVDKEATDIEELVMIQPDDKYFIEVYIKPAYGKEHE